MGVRTSQTHPLRVDAITLGTGELGMTFCPGKRASSLNGDPWERDLETDVDALRDWGTALVVTLIETHEMAHLGVTRLGEVVTSRGIDWRHAPIPDVRPPNAPFEAGWPELAAELTRRLAAGERVVVHCRGGLGRAGTVAAMMLMEFGATPAEAIKGVRATRPGAIETREQERYLLLYQPVTARTSSTSGPPDGDTLFDAVDQAARASAIASIAHRGQVDKLGDPYIDHPRRVAAIVSDDPVAVTAAWLHDVVEDTGISAADLAAAGIHPAALEAVILLTRTDGVPDDVYYRQIGSNPVARAVKLADIADNTAPDRVARLTESDRARLAAKYANARHALGAESEATR